MARKVNGRPIPPKGSDAHRSQPHEAHATARNDTLSVHDWESVGQVPCDDLAARALALESEAR
jgi:hypothetical protein